MVPEREVGILQWTEGPMVRMCGVQLRDRKRSNDLMLMLGLNRTVDQLAVEKQCLLVWSCVEERGRSHLDVI